MAAQEIRGCCPLDCQDGCAWIVHVEDGRVRKVVGAKDHPFTRGVLCAKVNDYQTKTYAEDRLLHPLRRSGSKGDGHYERIGWDDALDEIAERFISIIREFGAEALLPLHDMGSAGVLQRRSLMRLFHALGASRLHGSLCGASGNALVAAGHPIGFDPEEIQESGLVLLWGVNLLSTAHHHWHFCDLARKRNGATLIAIDPRRTRTAKRCDEHIQIRPGTDAVLAAALARVLVKEGLADFDYAKRAAADLDAYLEEIEPWTPERAADVTGVAHDDIERLARAFAAARPGTIRAGIGLEQSIDGDLTVLALSALSILAGHWRHRGGGLMIEAYPTLDNNAAERPDIAPEGVRSLDRSQLGRHLTGPDVEPPVKGLMIWGHNPIVSQIDAERVRQGLLREDLFTVVIEHFMTDTARHADIILPSTTQLEHFDVQGSWGQHYVAMNKPAIPPMGEARAHADIMRSLAERLGLSDPSVAEDDETIARSSLPKDFDFAQLKREGWVKASPSRPDPAADGPVLKLAAGLPGPTSGRVPGATPAGQLRLLSPKAHYFLNSTFGNMPRHASQQGPPVIEVNPKDASRLGLRDGQRVEAVNGNGSVAAALKITTDVVEGTAVIEGKWWWSRTDDGAPVANRICDGNWTAAGQPTFNDVFVRLEAAGMAGAAR